MRNDLVYDLPTRLFHWMFAGLFVFSFFIGKTVDDDSPVFSYHMLSGLILGFLVILRIVWGFLGTQHARFSSFSLNPKHLISYFKGMTVGDKTRWSGHNPASSWAAIVMMLQGLGLGLTGFLMSLSKANKESYEDVHELLANSFLLVAGLHIIGVLMHMFRHKDFIALSMLDGKKVDVPSRERISSPRTAFGVLLVALVVSFGIHLKNNYNPATGTLNLFNQQMQLGENEDKGGEKSEVGEGQVENANEGDVDDDDD